MTPENTLEAIIRAADSRKARDITAIRVYEQTTLTDYFVMMTGTSTTHIRALSEEIEHKLKEQGVPPHHIEGITSNWILMHYAVEHLWTDGQKIDVEPYLIKKEEENK